MRSISPAPSSDACHERPSRAATVPGTVPVRAIPATGLPTAQPLRIELQDDVAAFDQFARLHRGDPIMRQAATTIVR